MKKTIKVLSTTALLASVAAPFAAPVSANSTNVVDKVLSVSSNYSGSQNSIVLKEDDTAFDSTTGETFRVVLPSGVKFNSGVASGVTAIGASASASANLRADNILEVTVKGSDATANGEGVKIPLNFKVDGATGELKLKIESVDSTVTGGEYAFATVGSGNTTAVAQSVESIGETGKGGVIRIEETALDSIPVGTGKVVKLRLPSNFKWDTANTTVVATGALSRTAGDTFGGSSDQELTFKVDKVSNGQRGVIYITPGIIAKKDAAFGDVSVNVSGTDISDADVVVAKYSDWGVTTKVEAVNDIIAGKFDENTKTAKITIEETTAGSFLSGRKLDVTLPSWVKVTSVKEFSATGFTGGTPALDSAVDGKDNEFSIKMNGSTAGTNSKGKIEFKLELSVQGDKTGDIEALISGAGVPETKAVIAKAVAPVSLALSGEAAKVKIGTQSQDAPDVIITELKKGAIEKATEAGSSTGAIEVDLPEGVTFASVPKVEVVEGDGAIDLDNVRRINDNNTLTIPVKSESIKPMKIKLSGVKLTVNRTVPEGDIELKVGGNAVVENSKAAKGWLNGALQAGDASTLDEGEFNTSNAAGVVIATTVTPAPADTTAKNIVFKLNSKTFTVDGKELEMDAAPLVAWDRAFLPVRFAANALNVSDDNIIWDDKTSTATIFKGDRVIVAKVGDKFLTVNGTKIPMDVPVYRSAATQNRVMIPVRYLGNALGATIDWNQETSEITIQAK